MLMVRRLPTQLRKMQLRGTPVLLMVTILLIPIIRQRLRTCLASAESGRMVENRLRTLSCQIIQAIFLERNLR